MTNTQLVLVCDTETSGLKNNPATGHPDVIELSWQKLTDYWFGMLGREDFVDATTNIVLGGYPNEEGWQFSQRYKPSIEIEKGAFAIHGIPYSELADCPSHYEARLPEGVTYLIGHSISYDYRCLGKPEGVKLICTQRIAKKFKKHFQIPFENFQLDYLTSYFYPDRPELIKMNHTSLNDVCKTILVLAKLLSYTPKIQTFDALYDIQERL